MSSWPVPSSLDPGTQIFPALTPAHIDRIRPHAKLRPVRPGDILFRPGDTGVPFFVLLSGSMEITHPCFAGDRLITRHDAGAFTGEVNMLSGQPSLVLGRVTDPGEFLEVAPEGLRSLVARDAELSEIIMRAFILRRLALITNNLGNVVILGSRHSADTLRLREFLGRNGYPNNYIDLDTDKMSQEVLDRFHVKIEDIPVVICNGTTVLRNPSSQELADCLGMNQKVDGEHPQDLIIVGAGPAGLAAAVYAASEGLDVLLIETEAPGGQAGSSSKIENYLGFPTGVSGQELASRAMHQAQKFGAKMMVAHSIVKLDCDRNPYGVLLDDGRLLSARSIVIATGAQYKKPNLQNLRHFEGQGVYYGATYMESQLCVGEDVIVVGGGNSAGQA
ncbi:MAG TPA: FAD-dependent oxidoreductase, partial [Terriglobales bacterium]|nr:FAD-dependent oxidoreductase [Terriglobales bacterium]